MSKLSVVILTLNEEKNIGRCIDSVREIADETIVVDSFSTDKTKEICEGKKVTFIQHKFEGYIEQKNWAKKQASHQYVLSLDADEALSEALQAKILNMKNAGFKYDGYVFNRLTNYCGKWIRHCGWYPDRKLRLWNKEKGEWKGQNPHDRFEMQNDARIQFINEDILHYSFYTVEQHIETINKFSTISARELYGKGKRFSLLKLLFSPVWKFLHAFFIKKGFLDGFYGFVICCNSSHSKFLKQVKLYQLWSQKK
ncbi:MAG: glycosyltransferase family 2 protein [Bacteroidales bacterium]